MVAAALDTAPDDLELLADRVDLLRATGALEGARDALGDLASRAPANGRLPTLQALLLESSGDVEGSERVWAAIVKGDPTGDRAAARWARSLGRVCRYDEAQAVLDRALEHAPRSPALLAGRAEALIATSRFEEADAALASLEGHHPRHPRLHKLRAELMEMAGSIDRALEHRAADVEADPLDVGRRLRWARALKKAGRSDAAETAIEDGVALSPHCVELLVERAALLCASRPTAAQAAIDDLALSHPHHPRIAALRAQCFEAIGDIERAERMWADHITRHPRDVAGRLRRMRCLVRLTRHDEALAAIAEALAVGMSPPDLLAERIAIAVAQGLFDAAEADLRRLSDVSSGDRRLPQLRASLAAAMGDHETAERIFRDRHAGDPGNVAHRLHWTRALMKLGRHAEALRRVDDGLRLAPETLDLRVERIGLLIDTGQAVAAQAELEAFEVGGRTHSHVPRLRDRLVAACGDPEGSLEMLSAETAAHPQDAGRRLRWLVGLKQSGALDEALDVMARLPPVDRAGWHLWVDCLVEAGRWDEASEALARWPHRDAQGEVLRLMFLADLALMRFDHRAAMRHARAALAIKPQDHGAAQALVRAAACLFQVDVARQALNRVRIRGATGVGPPRRGVGRLRHLIGQILNELSLEPASTAALALAAERGDGELIATGAEQVVANPDSFGAALGLLIGLARAGRFDPTQRHDAGTLGVPRIVHQYWDQSEAPADVERLMKRAAVINKDCEYRRWNDTTACRYLAGLGAPDVLSAYRRSRHPAMKSDIFRLAVLFDSGGIYLDADDYCARELRTLIAPGDALVVYQENIGSIGNNFIAARPGHPIIGAALHRAARAVLMGASETLWLVTGPGLLSRCVASAAAVAPELRPEGLRVHDLASFRRVVHTARKASYKSDARSWKRLG